MIYQHFWDITKAVLKAECIALNVYTKKDEQSQISNTTFHLMILQKPKQITVTKRQEIILTTIKFKMRRDTIQKINETKIWFFEKIKRIDKLLPNLTNQK